MKIENYKDVEKAMKILETIEKQIGRCDCALDKIKEEDKNDKKEDLIDGHYWGRLSQMSDGSGWSIDLSGCYVSDRVILATKQALQDKKKEIEDYLKSKGVEL